MYFHFAAFGRFPILIKKEAMTAPMYRYSARVEAVSIDARARGSEADERMKTFATEM